MGEPAKSSVEVSEAEKAELIKAFLLLLGFAQFLTQQAPFFLRHAFLPGHAGTARQQKQQGQERCQK